MTVRATPDPLDITANLRAPLVISGGRGYQAIKAHENAPLRAPGANRLQLDPDLRGV